MRVVYPVMHIFFPVLEFFSFNRSELGFVAFRKGEPVLYDA